jgi:hypothetical protein
MGSGDVISHSPFPTSHSLLSIPSSATNLEHFNITGYVVAFHNSVGRVGRVASHSWTGSQSGDHRWGKCVFRPTTPICESPNVWKRRVSQKAIFGADHKPVALPSHAFAQAPFDINRRKCVTEDFERDCSQISERLMWPYKIYWLYRVVYPLIKNSSSSLIWTDHSEILLPSSSIVWRSVIEENGFRSSNGD